MKATTKLILTGIFLLLPLIFIGYIKTCEIEQIPKLPSPVSYVLPTVSPIPTAIEPSLIQEVQGRQQQTQDNINNTMNNNNEQQSNLTDAEAAMRERGLIK